MTRQLQVLGIDTSMVRTALVAHYTDGSEEVCSIIRPGGAGDLNVAGMVLTLANEVRDLLYCDANPVYVVTERLSGMRGPSEVNVTLPWAIIGAVVEALVESGSPDRTVTVLLPTPGQLKKFVTGSGSSEKAGVGRFIERRWPHAPEQEDEGEAYALMQFGLCRAQYEAGMIDRDNRGSWTKAQVELAAWDLWSKAAKLQVVSVVAAEAWELLRRWDTAVTPWAKISLNGEAR